MPSPLDYVSSEGFRKKLIARNLSAYPKSPFKPNPPLTYVAEIRDNSVIDSPDNLIDTPVFANNLYPLNQYGTEGGYKQAPDPGSLANTKSNEGEYGYQDANIIDEGYKQAKEWQKINPYGNPTNLIDSAEAFSTLDVLQINNSRGPNAQPYPTTFVPSSYGPASILLFDDPQGTDGLLSQDSYIAKLGAKILKKEFQERIGREIIQRTLGRINLLDVDGGADVLSLVTGRVPLLQPNYQITVPANPVIAATDLALRLAGSTIPLSPIPGSYFDTNTILGQPTTIQQISNAFRRTTLGSFFNRLVGATQSGSVLFLNNTGPGQKSRLFKNLDFNRFKPGYPRNIIDRLGGALVGDRENNSNYYIGSITSEPSTVQSPADSLPTNQFGIQQQSPVYGPSEIAKLYDPNSVLLKIGSNGRPYVNGGGIEGGFTWVSPKYKGNAGKKVGIGGQIVNQDEDFSPSSFSSTESTNNDFREGSILYDTQKLIESQPNTAKRYQHVGNAIDQVSKIFNDGYKEITKGSKVVKYVGSLGQERGTEYCRLFTKDVPYLQYNDLQKVDGITTAGRKYNYSVIDKTYNLNMYPVSQEGGQDSTNLKGGGETGYAKKYMFSLENLSWRTSNRPGYTYADLPICERGPNGGRVMWFPPYGLTFSETVTAGWNRTDFLGRPEPIYTYKNTSRGGRLEWKIVVDHPSVLNVVVNKLMNNESNRERVNSMIESFFAGCLKYDLYELAKKYVTVNPNDLSQIQLMLDEKKYSQEEFNSVKNKLQSGNESPNGSDTPLSNSTSQTSVNDFKKFVNFGFFFDYQKPNSTTEPYDSLYQQYVVNETYNSTQAKDPTSVVSFYQSTIIPNYSAVNELIQNLVSVFSSNNTEKTRITINLNSLENDDYSSNRIDVVQKFILNNEVLKNAYNNQKLQIIDSKSLKVAQPAQNGVENKTIASRVNCSKYKPDTESNEKKQQVFSVESMACRAVYITGIRTENLPESIKEADTTVDGGTKDEKTVENISPLPNQIDTADRPSISKKVLRLLLSECDYFEAIKENTPMVYDNLKDKLKFFQPAFHSTTPEGLNSRLTFLQQCMRPGDTIPVVKTDNQDRYELNFQNAINTSFGAPPVLVLRVGDFYNTKIIPESLSLGFEHLDINPEGIGLQPMIANVSLTFSFVGGSGLKEAVDRLQNSLTFNYYANTEMYDERAFPTDESYIKLDEMFVPPPKPSQVQNTQTNKTGSPIGEIISSKMTENGETGTISYTKFMDKVKSSVEAYYSSIMNKNTEILKQYNNAIRQQASVNRNYTDGSLNGEEVNLYGKPFNIEEIIDQLFTSFMQDIENDVEPFISYINEQNIQTKIKRQIRTNYLKYINQLKNSFQSSITTSIQEISNVQQNLINELSKVNTVIFKSVSPEFLTDGFTLSNGEIITLQVSGDTTVTNELTNDVNLLVENLQQFSIEYQKIYEFVEKGINYKSAVVFSDAAKIDPTAVFEPVSKKSEFEDIKFQRQYAIMNQTIKDTNKYENFKNVLLNISEGKDVVNEVTKYVDYYWKEKTLPVFEDENVLAEAFIVSLEKNRVSQLLPKLYQSKKREFSYTRSTEGLAENEIRDKKLLISFLAATTNAKNDKKTWNDKEDISLYRGKVKLN